MHVKYVNSRNHGDAFALSKLKNDIKSLAPSFNTAIVNYKSSQNSHTSIVDIKYKTQFDSKDMVKVIKANLITDRTNKKSSKNYGSYIYKSNKLDLFLNSTFNIISDNDSLISYIINNDLFEIFFKLPQMIKDSFKTFDMNLCLEKRYSNEKWIVIYVFTQLDGVSASNELDLLEDKLCDEFGDNCLDNILISVEFE